MTENDHLLEAARGRLSTIARGMALRFGADLAAASFAGALVGLVEHAHGREAAIVWLRELAHELEHDDAEAPTIGHA